METNPLKHPDFHAGVSAMARNDDESFESTLERYEFFVEPTTGVLHCYPTFAHGGEWMYDEGKWVDVNEDEDE